MFIKCCSKNILETSSVNLSTGTEDSDYPLYRLYDRDIGKIFKITAAVTMEVRVNQGASGNIAIDRLLIPAGHNLTGMTLDWQYSDDDISYTPAVTQWTQGDNALIDKSLTSANHQYWKFIVTSPAAIPQIHEIFMSPTYTWEQEPGLPLQAFVPYFNVENHTTAGGYDRFLIHGDEKKLRLYNVIYCNETQKTNILSLNDDWAGAKPFYLCDHNGVWIYSKLTEPVTMSLEHPDGVGGFYNFTLNIQEVIA